MRPFHRTRMAALVLTLVLLISASALAQGVPGPGYSHWMGDIADQIKNKPLREVLLPGTHDAATHLITKDSETVPDRTDCTDVSRFLFTFAPATVADWSKAQDKSILEQLKGGIRWMDLRLGLSSTGEIMAHHGKFNDTYKNIIQNVADFVNDPARSKEVVILSFSHWCNMTQDAHQKVVDELRSKLGSKIADRAVHTAETTLEKYWADGKQVVVIYAGDGDTYSTPYEFWYPDTQNAKSDSKIPKTFLSELNTSVGSTTRELDGSYELYSVGGALTPDGNNIANIFHEGFATSLKELAARVTPGVTNIAYNQARAGKSLNVVNVDFFSQPFVAALKTANRGFTIDPLIIGWEGSSQGWLNIAESHYGDFFGAKGHIKDGGNDELTNSEFSLAYFGGCMYAAYKGTDTSPGNIYLMRNCSKPWNPSSWESSTRRRIGFETSHSGPALGVVGKRLYLAWRGSGNNYLNLRWSADGLTWPDENKQTLSETTTASPALAGKGDYLYIAWKGTDSPARLNIMSSRSGGPFEHKITLSETSHSGPALAALNGELFLAWRGLDNNKVNIIRSYEGLGWKYKVTLEETTNKRPALLGAKGRLYVAWKGTGADFLNVAAAVPNPGPLVFRDHIRLTETSPSGPALAWLRRDTTPPFVEPSISGQLGTNGWYTGDVRLTWRIIDEDEDEENDSPFTLSGCSLSQITTETAGQAFHCQATNSAGLTASATATIKLDKTPPSVTLTGVANGATYPLGAVPAAACNTQDALSGVATAAVLSLTGGNTQGVGTITATCSGATDKAGNAGAPVSVTYTVTNR